MFVYSCSIKICASGFSKLLESIFCLPLVVETFSLQKIVQMLEEVVVSWQEVRWIGQMRQKFVAQFVKLLKRWFCDVWSSIVMEKNWALSVGQCRLQAWLFLVHLTDLLSILLRYNGLALIHSGPPNSDHHIFWMQVRLWEMLWSFFSIQPWNWLLIVI